jgi:signal transduction histidine kinase
MMPRQQGLPLLQPAASSCPEPVDRRLARLLPDLIVCLINPKTRPILALWDENTSSRAMSRLLVLENNHSQAQELLRLLESGGFEVQLAADGHKAYEAFSASDCDLVVADVASPGLSGYDLCRQVKAHPAKSAVPVILLSSLTDPSEIIRALECGADSLVPKQDLATCLIGRIKAVLQNTDLEKAGAAGPQTSLHASRPTPHAPRPQQLRDLLVTTFDDLVRTNRELQASRAELVSARSKLDEYARRFESQQAQTIETVGRLAGTVAHDFNNLLAVIGGYSEMLLSSDLPAESARALILEIRTAWDRAAALTRQLLTFSRRQTSQPRLMDLNALVSDTDKMLGRLFGEDIKLNVVLDSSLGRIKADPGQLAQLIMTLAFHARAALPGGGQLTIETRRVTLDTTPARPHSKVKPGTYATLAIRATSCRLDDARRFEPFFWPGSTTLQRIVSEYDGYLEVISEPNLGSGFTIYFPVADERPSPALLISETG